jgi:hypothetical protein
LPTETFDPFTTARPVSPSLAGSGVDEVSKETLLNPPLMRVEVRDP